MNSFDVWSLFTAAAAAAPTRPALHFEDRTLSFRELRQLSTALCETLIELGVTRHSRVALLLPNSPLYVGLYLALAALGAIAIPVNHRLSLAEIQALLEESQCHLLVLDEASDARLAPGPGPRITEKSLRERMAAHAGCDGRYQYTQVDPSDPCVIFYTSGTTGQPKGVMRTQLNVCATVQTAIGLQQFTHDTVLLAPLPLFHISGWETKMLSCLIAGGCAVLTERYSPERVLELVEQLHVTYLFLVPTMTHDLVQHPGLASRDLQSLRYWHSGTAPLPKALRDQVMERLPGLRFRISYGTTEAGIIAMFDGVGADVAAGCVGRVVPGVHLRIVDDHGVDVPDGDSGEIWCAAPSVTTGFYRGEQLEPAPACNPEHWIATGDLGSLDAKGYLHVSGRKKDVIISGGENIVAGEVESVLRAHPLLQDAAVIGMPDPRWGEAVLAFVVAKGEERPAHEVLTGHCRAALAGYKCPRRFVYLEALPRTPIGKVSKAVLRQLAADLTTSESAR